MDGVSKQLFEIGVLTMRNGNVTTTADFDSEVEEFAEEITSLSFEELIERVHDCVEREGVIEPFAQLGSDDARTLAELFVLHDRLEPTVTDDWLSLLPVLRLFRSQDMPIRGVPESFIPVPATQIPYLTQVYSPAVVYVWLDDCPPCDTVREDLESLFEKPQGVMPFAVYGPDDQQFLRKEYDVTAGPALLFMRSGRIDSRLYGAHPIQTVKSELTKFSG